MSIYLLFIININMLRQILAEGEEPETNILRVLLRNRAKYCEADRGRNLWRLIRLCFVIFLCGRGRPSRP